MSRSSRGRWALIAIVAVAASCGGGDGADDDATQPDGDTIDTTEASEPSSTASTSAPATTEAASTTSTTVPDAALALAGADPIVQTTDTSGGGTRPLLRWEPVDGAAGYIVVVFAESGEPYWSAVTEQSEVFVGGPAQIPEDNGGPRVAQGYSWIVYAQDADQALIASSPQRDISP